MACLGIRYGGAGDCLLRKQAAGFNSLSIPKLSVKSSLPTISTTATSVHISDHAVSRSPIEAIVDIVPLESFVDDEEYDPGNDRSYENFSVSETIDEWMRNSVTEIVKNIKQAPLLVQIYANGVVKTEKAVAAEDWPDVVSERPSPPDGIILVEELRDAVDYSDEEEGTKAFGVVIQCRFKGRDRCRSACYLLKTCSVNGGMGPFCTHFCLMKVHSFSKTASSQLNDCWLLP
ncbi:hypothetical protein R6Q59_029444 [Mikania micrantha]|uniref:DUF7804 domain-containing protein n=1 Tax=Mikania micrantha TaxID=192012 RepID=A0A5N6LUM0_9ASTR|nr:hypothetical protein E3N88_38661 [Mikania micrantha]